MLEHRPLDDNQPAGDDAPQGADVGELGGAALWAAREGKAANAIALIGMGAPIDFADADGRTMLHHCAADVGAGRLALLAYLLSEGANPMARERSRGATPLAWACYSKNPDATRLLAGHGDVDDMDFHGRTALFHCASHNGDANCAEILLRRGAKLHLRASQDHRCAFEEAILQASPAALVMAAKADFSRRALDGSTWMELASRKRGYITDSQREAIVASVSLGDAAVRERDELKALLSLGEPAAAPPRKTTL